MTDELKTRISFELESNTSVTILRDGKEIGRVWSQHDDGCTPYPHKHDSYCLNSIQICGFDKISQVWQCGPFHGHKDVVVHFIPSEDEYHQQQKKLYERYVKGFFGADTKVLKPLDKILSFSEWIEHGDCNTELERREERDLVVQKT